MAIGEAKLGNAARRWPPAPCALLAALALAVLAAPAAAEAPYEPNDAITAAAGPLLIGQSYFAALELGGDRDYYSFHVTSPGDTPVTLGIQNLGGGGKMSDIDATVLDASSTPIAAQAFIRDGESRLIAATLQPQKYYVEVSANEGFGDSYSLTPGSGGGAFGPYAQIAGRCTRATVAARRASRRLSRARSRLQRTTGRVRRSRYAPPVARRKARKAHWKARRLVRAKRRALRAARRSSQPWCSIAP
jgi:hypothetical protein